LVISRGTPTNADAYRPEKFDSEKLNYITAKLLSIQLICRVAINTKQLRSKEMIFWHYYYYIILGTDYNTKR